MRTMLSRRFNPKHVVGVAATGVALTGCNYLLQPYLPPPAPTSQGPSPASTGQDLRAIEAALPPDYMKDCDANEANGVETDTRASDAHCGACGNACGKGLACVAGTCRAPRRLAAFGHMACAVESGKVACWGTTPPGQKAPSASPVWIEGIEGAVSVARGYSGTCVVMGSGKLVCWRDREGSTAQTVAEDVVDVGIGISDPAVAALTKDGQFIAVAYPYDPSLRKRASIDLLKSARQVSVGPLHACALLEGGSARCWGIADQSGSGAVAKDPIPIEKAVEVKGLSDAMKISADHHSCAVRKSGKLTCWGSAFMDGLPGMPKNVPKETPIEVAGISDAVDVAANGSGTCIVRASGKVSCWGPWGKKSRAISDMPEVTDATEIAGGDGFSCVRRASGKVSCWGETRRGQLGHGKMSEVTAPTIVPGVSGATKIAAGNGYTCVTAGAANDLTCWGIGDTPWTPKEKWGPVAKVASLSGIVEIQSASKGLCALSATGKWACFDGDERAAPHDAPPFQGPGSKAKNAAKKLLRGWGNEGAALLTSGEVALWYKTKTSPVTGLSGAVDLAMSTVGADSLCAVLSSGKVGCVVYASSPFAKKDPGAPSAVLEVPGISDAASIVGDGGRYCVLRKSAEVACWRAGDVRTFSGADATKPAVGQRFEVRQWAWSGVKQVVTLDGVSGTLCALLADGHVSCAGSNYHGELGNGNFESRDTIGEVPELSDVTAITAGEDHLCALKKTGEVACWGENRQWAAGQMDVPIVETPVDVKMPPK